jgi:hypothetical protein
MPTDSASTTQVTGLIPVVSPSDRASIALSSVPGDSIAVGTHGGEKRESQEGVVVRVAVDCSLLFIHERLVANSADKPDLQSLFFRPGDPSGHHPSGYRLGPSGPERLVSLERMADDRHSQIVFVLLRDSASP